MMIYGTCHGFHSWARPLCSVKYGILVYYIQEHNDVTKRDNKNMIHRPSVILSEVSPLIPNTHLIPTQPWLYWWLTVAFATGDPDRIYHKMLLYVTSLSWFANKPTHQ